VRVVEQTRSLDKLLQDLPAEIQKEVWDFAEFLLLKRAHRPFKSHPHDLDSGLEKPGRRLRQDWAGALREYRDQYTALDLQRMALEWRGD